jgi:hypothetical protein
MRKRKNKIHMLKIYLDYYRFRDEVIDGSVVWKCKLDHTERK